MTEQEVISETNGKDNKEEPTKEDPDIESAIIRQVEYYFGDVNLGRDKFLREQVTLDDGWLPLEVLIKFKRLAKMSTDCEFIANTLKKSTSGLLEISEDNKKLRRNPEMPVPEMNEERRKELMSRTIYAKGFPKDSILDDLLKFFKEQGDVENLIMRRYEERQTKKRLFKGSVFATFKTKEEAEKFLQNTGVKYGDTELIVLWQEQYIQKKQEEYAETKANKEKKNKDKEAKGKEEKPDLVLPTGTVLQFSEGDANMKRENVKEALEPLLPGTEIAYIDFKVGDPVGWVRFAKENQAKEAAEKIPDGKIKINDKEVVFKLLEGDEEKKYLEKTVEEMVKRRKNQKNFKNNRNFKGKQNRKRKQEGHDDAPPSKVKADS